MSILQKPPKKFRGHFSYGEEQAVSKLAQYLPHKLSILEIGTYFGKGVYHTLSHLQDRDIELSLINKDFGITEEHILANAPESMKPHILSGPNGTVNVKFMYGDFGFMPEPSEEEKASVSDYVATKEEIHDILRSLFTIDFFYQDNRGPVVYSNDTNLILYHLHTDWSKYIQESIDLARKKSCFFTFRHGLDNLLHYCNEEELELIETLYEDEWSNYCLVKFR